MRPSRPNDICMSAFSHTVLSLSLRTYTEIPINMIHSIRFRCLGTVLAGMVGAISLDASAVMQQPTGRNDIVEAIRDRGAPVGDVIIFSRASGGYDSDAPEKWGTNSWTCESLSDTATGACPTEPTWGGPGSATDINLSFKEEKTGATAILTLEGSTLAELHRTCSGAIAPSGIIGGSREPIEKAMLYILSNCPSNVYFDGRLLYVKIPASELKKLPSGGTWKANLKLNLRSWATINSPKLAVFRAEIKLDVTDKDNIQIYLPEFATATPIVDLKLRKLPNGSRMAGTSNVDLCLYDGYNAQSTWFDISASDGLTVDRRDQGQYSVLLDKDKSGSYESRVDYSLSLTYAGKKIALPNNEKVRLQGVNNTAGRSVSLPGISVPVICTPAPLTLETPEFQSVWKRPGKYSNKLTITFTPSSANL